jgi:hypothetical protein
LCLRLKSGNREVIEDTPPQISSAQPTEKKEEAILPFQKPVSLLPANMRTTPIKETLEKHAQKTTEKENDNDNDLQEIYIENKEKETATETNVEQVNIPIESPEIQENKVEITENILVPLSKECWDECVKNSCGTYKIAEIILLKVNPSPTDDYKIEFEIANEIEKNAVKQVQTLLLQKLHEKTGNVYSLEMQITKIIREKTIDKTNPDEKFIHLCKENPHLLEFKQRLNLSVS